MKKYNYTIAIDIDGVIADFEGEFCDRFGYENREIFKLEDRYPDIDPDIIQEFQNSPDTYEKLLPIFGGAVVLCGVAKSTGAYILLITSRPKHLAEVTRNWLDGYDIQFDELWFGKNKQVAISEFNQMYPNKKVKALVDDTVSNLTNLPDGAIGIAWQQPWNNGYYPRARYNGENMSLEIQGSNNEEWKPWGTF